MHSHTHNDIESLLNETLFHNYRVVYKDITISYSFVRVEKILYSETSGRNKKLKDKKVISCPVVRA